MKASTRKPIQRSFKRLLDILVASTVLFVSFPILFSIGALIRIRLGKPVFFRQLRPGLHGRNFSLLKFRTMSDRRDSSGHLLPDEMRLDNFGKSLRALSLDELPQLINVLKGEMSLVGPRPLLVQYLPLYDSDERRRHDVPPGITGWAQVNGRNAIEWKKKFALDIYYVDHWSLWFDLKILLLTVVAVLRRRGVAKSGHVTTVPFDGTN